MGLYYKRNYRDLNFHLKKKKDVIVDRRGMLTRTENVMTTILSQDRLKNFSSSIAELIWYSRLEPIHDQCILVMIEVYALTSSPK